MPVIPSIDFNKLGLHRILVLVINIFLISYFSYILGIQSADVLVTDRIFLGYLIFAILSLPFLFSVTILKSPIASLKTALSFLIYPAEFAFIALLSLALDIEAASLLSFTVILNLAIWNILFYALLFPNSHNKKLFNESLSNIILALIPAVFYSIFVTTFIRQPDSVVAIDYLQHITVPNAAFYDNVFCILPGHCSNLFLQHGYTTFYHSILGNLAVFLPKDPITPFYLIDLIYPLVASIPIYAIFKRLTKSAFWSQLGVLLSLLVFVMGGNDFIFFIPQTFAFLLFLLILSEPKLSTKKFIISTLLLIATHFVLGAVFALYLWLKHLIIDNIRKKHEIRWYIEILLSFIAFAVLVNASGFSIEKIIQINSLDLIGGVTNLYYPDNIITALGNLGAVWIYVVIAILAVFLTIKNSQKSLPALTFLMIGTGLYFFAPTYANKFMIGTGIFSAILIIKYLSQLKFGVIPRLIVGISLVTIFGLNFYIQYNRYLAFYTQEDGTVSAIVEEDKPLINFLQSDHYDRFIISDPYTQLIAASLGHADTANAQYMQLETRAYLQNYINYPSPSTYEDLRHAPGVPSNKDFDILYTSRLHRSLIYNDTAWLYNMYSLSINNSEPIEHTSKELMDDMKALGKEPIRISDNFILFTSKQ